MSGTSLDGVDLCAAEYFFDKSNWTFKILAAETVLYPPEWKNRLQNAHQLNAQGFLQTDVEYAQYLVSLVNAFLDIRKGLSIDFISSHGHTIFHHPQNKWGFQLGNHPILSSQTGLDLVCDFRRQDLALGGQGAPLVPIGDTLLFANYDACLNLGGFANLSYKNENQRLAFDVCPLNVLLNEYALHLGFDYDAEGKLARNGKLIPKFFRELEMLLYYKQKSPKSLGVEWVEAEVKPILQKYKDSSVEDILHTLVAHFSTRIAETLKIKNCLVSGGGAYNSFLIAQIQAKTTCELIVADDLVINYKESLIFGLLGILRREKQINVLKSVTGASKDHSSGVIYTANNNL